MPSDEKIVISFLFNRSGKEKLTSSEIYLSLSMELNWFTLQEAKQFLKNVIKNQLLIKDGGYYKPNFKIADVNVPIGFQPAKIVFIEDNLDKRKVSLIDEIVGTIAKTSDFREEDIIKNINEIANKRNIFPIVASLIFAKEYDIDLSDFFMRAYEEIFKEN
jgi:hypothetical protein